MSALETRLGRLEGRLAPPRQLIFIGGHPPSEAVLNAYLKTQSIERRPEDVVMTGMEDEKDARPAGASFWLLECNPFTRIEDAIAALDG